MNARRPTARIFRFTNDSGGVFAPFSDTSLGGHGGLRLRLRDLDDQWCATIAEVAAWPMESDLHSDALGL